MATSTKTPEEALYRTLQDGDATHASLKKATGLDDEAFDAYMNEVGARLWIDRDDSGRTTHYALTDVGRRALAVRYPD